MMIRLALSKAVPPNQVKPQSFLCVYNVHIYALPTVNDISRNDNNQYVNFVQCSFL